jgi:uncharacterized membrane protein HdeD (DUF308 family)
MPLGNNRRGATMNLIQYYVGDWRRLTVHGVVAMLFGLATLVWPDLTLWALVVLWGAFAIVDGAVSLSTAIASPIAVHRGWLAFRGVVGIAAGIVTFAWPSITALALLCVIAAWALVSGGALIAVAVRVRKQVTGEWRVALMGATLLLLGLLLVIDPGSGAIGLTWAIGWLALLYGSLELATAMAIRHESRQVSHDLERSGTAHLVS